MWRRTKIPDEMFLKNSGQKDHGFMRQGIIGTPDGVNIHRSFTNVSCSSIRHKSLIKTCLRIHVQAT
jgi:hypothetical protein